MKPCFLVFEDAENILAPGNKKSDSQNFILPIFLKEIDSIQNNEQILVFITAPDKNDIDESVRRSCRIDREIKLEMPHWKTRTLILSSYLGSNIS